MGERGAGVCFCRGWACEDDGEEAGVLYVGTIDYVYSGVLIEIYMSIGDGKCWRRDGKKGNKRDEAK